MRANELRIGSWVRTKQTKREFQIKGSALSFSSSIESNYEGIPLTEQWLLKFGFEREGWNDSYAKIHGWAICKEDFYVQICIDEKLRLDGCGLSIPIEYVHQLQNLYFALTGKELKIKEPAK